MARPKSEYRTGSKESFQKFRKSYPEIKITLDQFVAILHSHALHLTEYILETGELVKMPFGLGTLTIAKYKKSKERYTQTGKTFTNLPPDWSKTLQLWRECEECKAKKQLVFHLNSHTQGYYYYWRWNINKVTIRAPYLWTFSLNREHGRKLKDYLLQPNSHYKEIYKTYNKK